MQSRKTSKQTRKGAEQTVAAAPDTGTPAPEVKTNSRASQPSTTKKTPSETGRAKHRKVSVTETAPVIPAARAMESPVIDPVGVMTPSPEAQEITHEHISHLAYSYWIARDYVHGFAEEDWHRAERDLKH